MISCRLACCALLTLTFGTLGCGSGTGASRQVPVTPTAPSGGSSGPVTLSTLAAVSPVSGDQLSTLRPTLTVQNATLSQQGGGTRTYEFQVSDRTDFSIGSSLTAAFLVSVNQTGVPGATYRPSPHYAFLGSNQSVFGSDAGTFPGATYRNLWIGSKPRPATLGNALD